MTPLISLLMFLCVGLVDSSNLVSNLDEPGNALTKRGSAISHDLQKWESALKEVEPQSCQTDDEKKLYIDKLNQLAEGYQMMGNYTAAQSTMQRALVFAEANAMLNERISTLSQLGDITLALQQSDNAEKYLKQALALANQSKNVLAQAHVLNNLGNLLNVQQNQTEALKSYQQAQTLAAQKGEVLLQVQALLNQVHIYLNSDIKNDQAAVEALQQAFNLVNRSPDSKTKAFQLLSIGQSTLRLQERVPQITSIGLAANQKALQLAKSYQDNRLTAYAKGYLGQLYEQAKQFPEALQLTREAIFLSQDMPDLLYRWEWQRGRILQAQGDLTNATAAYQQAVNLLQPIRTSLATGQRDSTEVFYQRIRPVYFGLADILLRQAVVAQAKDKKQALLNEARATIEQLKAAELQNYFQDACVSANQKTVKLDHLSKRTAVFYPILLPDRTELLLSLPDGIHQTIVPVTADTLNQTTVEFQKNLQIRTTFEFFTQARQLYDWLIAPIRAQLTQSHIDTIVVVPDATLRMIPLGALHDGDHFLIESFALATTPSLDLTDPRPLPRQSITALLNGLSEGVQRFSPLPNVVGEIKNLSHLFDKRTVLLNQEFSLSQVNRALQNNPFSIVHVASHGTFNRDPNKTFLLTYDDKLTMNQLENLLAFSQFRKDPVELLTLSACQTAVGDERAALGLAGVAIKAGARSAIASLWFVNDETTTELVSEFYKQLRNPELSKAQALQNAQKKLIAQRLFRHPMYWAPFLLIGNWL